MAENDYTKEHRAHGVPGQIILDCGLNVFAIQLLVESYTDHPKPIPIVFPYRGVLISLALAGFPDNQSMQAEAETDGCIICKTSNLAWKFCPECGRSLLR